MAREIKLRGLVLRKQLLRETDEIITVYSLELGKVRLLARGIKRPTSKFQYVLVPATELSISAAGSSELPTVIYAQSLQVFAELKNSEHSLRFFYWLAELLIKATADHEANQPLYKVSLEALSALNKNTVTPNGVEAVTGKFALDFLNFFGAQVRLVSQVTHPAYFSNSAGGFTTESHPDNIPVTPQEIREAELLSTSTYTAVSTLRLTSGLRPLLLNFITYTIERRLNSERFL